MREAMGPAAAAMSRESVPEEYELSPFRRNFAKLAHQPPDHVSSRVSVASVQQNNQATQGSSKPKRGLFRRFWSYAWSRLFGDGRSKTRASTALDDDEQSRTPSQVMLQHQQDPVRNVSEAKVQPGMLPPARHQKGQMPFDTPFEPIGSSALAVPRESAASQVPDNKPDVRLGAEWNEGATAPATPPPARPKWSKPASQEAKHVSPTSSLQSSSAFKRPAALSNATEVHLDSQSTSPTLPPSQEPSFSGYAGANAGAASAPEAGSDSGSGSPASMSRDPSPTADTSPSAVPLSSWRSGGDTGDAEEPATAALPPVPESTSPPAAMFVPQPQVPQPAAGGVRQRRGRYASVVASVADSIAMQPGGGKGRQSGVQAGGPMGLAVARETDEEELLEEEEEEWGGGTDPGVMCSIPASIWLTKQIANAGLPAADIAEEGCGTSARESEAADEVAIEEQPTAAVQDGASLAAQAPLEEEGLGQDLYADPWSPPDKDWREEKRSCTEAGRESGALPTAAEEDGDAEGADADAPAGDDDEAQALGGVAAETDDTAHSFWGAADSGAKCSRGSGRGSGSGSGPPPKTASVDATAPGVSRVRASGTESELSDWSMGSPGGARIDAASRADADSAGSRSPGADSPSPGWCGEGLATNPIFGRTSFALMSSVNATYKPGAIAAPRKPPPRSPTPSSGMAVVRNQL